MLRRIANFFIIVYGTSILITSFIMVSSLIIGSAFYGGKALLDFNYFGEMWFEVVAVSIGLLVVPFWIIKTFKKIEREF